MTLEQYLLSRDPKISHEDFGKIVGVTQATINRYVRGERFPSPEMIAKIQNATEELVCVTDWYSPEQKRAAREVTA